MSAGRATVRGLIAIRLSCELLGVGSDPHGINSFEPVVITPDGLLPSQTFQTGGLSQREGDVQNGQPEGQPSRIQPRYATLTLLRFLMSLSCSMTSMRPDTPSRVMTSSTDVLAS